MTTQRPLDRSNLVTPEGIRALGVIAANALDKIGVAAFVIDSEGMVIPVPPECVSIDVAKMAASPDRPIFEGPEVDLDELPEEGAIEKLVAQGKDEDDIMAYFSRREIRLQLTKVDDDLTDVVLEEPDKMDLIAP